MLSSLLRAVLVVVTATVLVAPAMDVAGARGAERASSSGSALLTQEQPSATPTATPTAEPSASATPTATATATPTATPTPTPTRTPEPTRTPGTSPFVPPTRTPEPSRKPESTTANTWELLVRVCLEARSVDADACFRYLSASGISLNDLRAKVIARLDDLARQQAARSELEMLLRKCLESQGVDSDACMQAWRLSGLSLEEFKVMIMRKLGTTTKPVSELETWIKKCLDSHELYGAECYHAYQISGLSSEDFDKKILAAWGAKH